MAANKPGEFKPDGIDHIGFGRSFFWENVPYYCSMSNDRLVHFYRAFDDDRIVGLFVVYHRPNQQLKKACE